jgi:hypothetical protein
MNSGELSREEFQRHLEMLTVTVNFDQLCADGILSRVGKKKFNVPDMQRLPEHVRLRVRTIDPEGVVEFANTKKRASKLLKRLKP